MSKTIKELADELGVPKNKVNYQLSKIDAQSVSKFVKIKHGVKHLETPIQKMIADNMRLKLSDQKSFKNDEFKQVINHLEEQNKAKDQQIKELHRLLDTVPSTDVCQRWWKYMTDVMPANADNSPVSSELHAILRASSLVSISLSRRLVLSFRKALSFS